MTENAQWVAYRVEPGAMLKAPLPSAPEIGDGWRGVELRRFHPLDQLDDLLRHTVTQVDAAIGLAAAGEGYAYVIADTRRGNPIRAVLGVDPTRSHAGPVRDALDRCGLTGRGARWRKSTARALAAWSVHAPRTAGDAVLGNAGSLAPSLTTYAPTSMPCSSARSANS
jgi:hypothetical protein